MSRLIEVAVPLPVFSTFTYRLPLEFEGCAVLGMRALVPFGKRIITGYVLGDAAQEPGSELKDVIDILDPEPLFSPSDLRFYRWIADYYLYPLGLTIKTALPPGITVEYQDRVAITSQGIQALEKTDHPDKDLLLLLIANGPLSLKSLRKKAGTRGFSSRINRLSRAGLITITRTRKRCTTTREEFWYSAADNQQIQPLRRKQTEMLEYIKQCGPVCSSALRARFGNCTRVLAALQKKGLITATLREALRLPRTEEPYWTEPHHQLTHEQRAAIDMITPWIQERRFYPVLLYGITGSGKTEVYLQVMQQVLSRRVQCLYLVPEIALTAQLYDRIASRLQLPVLMLHSGLSDGERFDAWRMIARGEVRLVIGARSALFAPFVDLGAIIVDEEHDSSYKQEDGLRYNARDMAVVRAQLSSCVVVLGSATPSLESYANACEGKYNLAVLTRRVENRPLPRVTIVPMTHVPTPSKGALPVLSEPLRQAISMCLAEGKQCLLFLNRRGFALVYVCQMCGAALRCPNCAVSLIYHRNEKRLRCHYCGHVRSLPTECPSCGSYFFAWLGWGTERLEAELAMLFPKARIARMDRDTMAQRGAARNLIRNMSKGAIDILVGTQMLVKGYHLPEVTLVGVVCADQSLHFPDYRASERTFQLLTQVAGRAGRGDSPGEVIVQTYTPDHYSIRCAQHHDYKTFYAMEMETRRELGYPPYAKIVILRFEGTNRATVNDVALTVGSLSRALDPAGAGVQVLGPCPAPIEKIRSRWRFHMLLKAKSSGQVRAFARLLAERARQQVKRGGVTMIIDVDPLQVI